MDPSICLHDSIFSFDYIYFYCWTAFIIQQIVLFLTQCDLNVVLFLSSYVQSVIAEVPDILYRCVSRDEAALAMAQKVCHLFYFVITYS
jgi:hypothetical protein